MNDTAPPLPQTSAMPTGALDQAAFEAMQREHTQWLISEGKEGRRANLRDADLRFIDFADANLVQANFRGADLRGCDLSGAQLQDADFTEARLSSANLAGVNLERSSFVAANLERAILDGANAAFTNFLDANLTEASLRHTSLPGAMLRQAIARRALFDHANLSDVNARECALEGARFHSTRMARADLRESRCDHAEFVDTQFEQTQFKGATFQGVSFSASNFAEALEIAQEYKTVAIQEERGQIGRERETIERERTDLASREAAWQEVQGFIVAQKALLVELTSEEIAFSGRLQAMAKRLKIFAAIWALVFLAVASVTGYAALQLPPNSLNGPGIALVIGVPALVLALALVTAITASLASQRIREQLQLRERKLLQAHTPGNETLSAPSPSAMPDMPEFSA